MGAKLAIVRPTKAEIERAAQRLLDALDRQRRPGLESLNVRQARAELESLLPRR